MIGRSFRSIIEPLETRTFFAVDLIIDANQKFQTIDGFGTSIAGWVDGVYENSTFYDMYWKDLGSSMLRVALNPYALTIGGDLSKPVSLGSDINENIAKFDFNSPNIRRFGNVAKASLTRKIDKVTVFASIWTPPHWMKGAELNPYNGTSTGKKPYLDKTSFAEVNTSGGSLIDTPENLTQFGRYVSAYVKGFEKAYGVPIAAISLQNELAFHEPYNSCVYTPALYVKAVKAVYSAFQSYGITTKLIGPEDVGVGSTSDPYILRRQFEYIKALRADPVAKQAIWGYAIHGYANDGVTNNRSPAMWGQYWNGRTTDPKWTGIKSDAKRSWMTETSGQAQSWDGAMNVGASILDSLVYGNTNAWTYWQASNATTVKISESLALGTDTTSFKYVAAKHFFKYVRPGSQRVSSSLVNTTGLYSSAFVDPAAKTLTSVVMNQTSSSQSLRIKLNGITTSTFDKAIISSSGKLWNNMGAISFSGGFATLTLPAKSILTLQGSTSTTPTNSQNAVISGYLFFDSNKNGNFDVGESRQSAKTVFIDLDDDNVLDSNESKVVTDAQGQFTFSNLPAGTFKIRRVVPTGYKVTTPARNITVSSGQIVMNVSIGTSTV